MNVDKVGQLDTKVIACHLVDLYAALLNVVGAQANENGISSFLASIGSIRKQLRRK